MLFLKLILEFVKYALEVARELGRGVKILSHVVEGGFNVASFFNFLDFLS